MKSRRIVFGLFIASQVFILAYTLVTIVLYSPHTAQYTAWAVAVVLCVAADSGLYVAMGVANQRSEKLAQARAIALQQQAAGAYAQRLAAERAAAQDVKAQVRCQLERASKLLAEGGAQQDLLQVFTQSPSVAAPLCDNALVDAVLSIAARNCAERNIRFICDAVAPRDISLPDTEVCAVLSNMLNNAVAAAAATAATERFVSVKVYKRAGFFVVECANSCAAEDAAGADAKVAATASMVAATASMAAATAHAKQKQALRSIGEEHGWGQDILATIAARHGGVYEAHVEDSTYTCMVALGL